MALIDAGDGGNGQVKERVLVFLDNLASRSGMNKSSIAA